MEYRGTVVKRMFGQGSKSEHEAVMLDTAVGSFVLQRIGGNPFFDPTLNKLVGKSVVCHGKLHGHTLKINDCEIMKKENAKGSPSAEEK